MEWQPIETAPKDGTRIWVYIGGDKQTMVRYMYGYWTCYMLDDKWLKWVVGPSKWLTLDPGSQPTHWMPLPPPPAQRAKGSAGDE